MDDYKEKPKKSKKDTEEVFELFEDFCLDDFLEVKREATIKKKIKKNG
jgi:hypothetical protein